MRLKNLHPIWLGLLLGACGASHTRPAAPPPSADTVIMISLDGFRHDYPARVDTPAFDRMATEGAHADRLIPVFPSQTFANHASLVTGVRAGRHGILNNRFFDRERGLFDYDADVKWYDRPPLWILSTQAGLRTYVLHWIGIEGSWEGVHSAVAEPFDKTVTDDQKIDRILGWLRGPPADRPRLILSYFRGCDHPGHVDGPDAPSVTACIRDTDARLGRLLDGLGRDGRAHYTVVIVSDHGMTRTLGEISPTLPFAQLGEAVRVVAVGPVAHVFVPDRTQFEAARRRAEAIPHVRVYTPDTLPPKWGYRHPTRTGDLILVADYGWRFNAKLEVPISGPVLPGHHGHDPSNPEMSAIFYMWGVGVRPGASTPTLHVIDVMPTVMRLVGLEPPADVDGHVAESLLMEDTP